MSFAALLKSIRESKDISQETLGTGLSESNSFISRIENGEYQTDKMTRDLLLGRLGYTTDGFEEFLHPEEYEIWHERQSLLHALQEDNNGLLEKALRRYDVLLTESMRIARQLSVVMHTHLMRVQRASIQDVHQKYEEALLLTVPTCDFRKLSELPLSPQELNILLEYIDTSAVFGVYERSIVMQLINNVISSSWEPHLKVKLLPKIVYYYLRREMTTLERIEDIKKAFRFCDTSIDLLRDTHRSFYAVELLETKEKLLSHYGHELFTPDMNEQQIQQTRKWKDAIEEAFKQCGLSPLMTNDGFLYDETEVYAVGEVICKRRKMLGMTQERLAEKSGVGKTTIYRAEKGNTRLQADTFRLIFRALSLPAEPMMREVITDNSAVFGLINKFKNSQAEHQYDASKVLLDQIEQMISANDVHNLQYLMRCRAKNKHSRKALTTEQFIASTQKALELTITLPSVLSQRNVFLTKGELLCLQNMIVAFEEIQMDVMPYLRFFESFFQQISTSDMTGAYINLYEFIMTMCASMYGNLGLFKHSNAISRQVMYNCMRRHRLLYVCRNIYSIYWNTNVENRVFGKNAQNELDICVALSNFCKRKHMELFYSSVRNP